MGKIKLAAEKEQLIDLYWNKKMTMKQIARVFGCSTSAVCLRFKRDGIEARSWPDYAKPKVKKIRKDAWSESEIKYLCENYENTPNSEIAKNLPKRTAQGIYKKAKKLGLKESKEKEFNERSEHQSGEKSRNWKGGRCYTKRGYVQIKKKGHHRADKHGYVLEHILVWENEHNLILPEGYCIHHLNGVKDDNRPENLVALTVGEHTALHNRMRFLERQKGCK